MKERIRNNVYMTVCGLLLYLGSVWLSRSYHLPSDIAFGCFFASVPTGWVQCVSEVLR